MFVTLPASAAGAAPTESDAPATVLYVTDDPANAARVRAALRVRTDLRVVEADTRAMFDTLLAGGGVDVVLCALVHPHFDGQAAIAAAGLHDPRLPVVVLAEPGHEDLIESATRAGAWSYLIKTPRYPERLHHAIHAVLAQRHALELRSQAETALARIRSSFDATLAHVIVGIAHMRADGHCLLVNERLCEILGRSREQLVGSCLFDLIPVDANVRSAWPSALGSMAPRSVRFERLSQRRDGAPLRLAVTLSPAGMPDGTLIVVVEDVSVRYVTEAAIRAQARRQRLVAAFARQALERVSHLALARQALHVLAQGTNADCSRLMRIHPDGTRYRWVAHAGWTRPPLGVSQPCGAHERWVLVSPGPLAVADYRAETRFVPARDIAAQGLASGIEIRLMVGGKARAILGAYSRDVGWCNADNMEFIAIIAGILTNAIERARADTRLTWLNRALERKVDRRTAELRDAYRRIESFSYSIAHDLRAPLHVTSAFAGLLRDSDAATLSDEGRHSLERVMGGVSRMAGLIEDVLAFSRQGFGPLDPQAVDMTAIARAAAAEFAVEHPRAHLRIDPLAPAYGDSGALARVFANLIGNAFKYSAPVAAPAIHVGCRREGAQTVYFVADNGVGFDPAFAARLFGLFQRMHSAREFSGSGIGLAIARQIVERHTGRIWAEAAPGGAPASISPSAAWTRLLTRPPAPRHAHPSRLPVGRAWRSPPRYARSRAGRSSGACSGRTAGLARRSARGRC